VSEFWIAMNDQFGESFARVIYRDVVLPTLGGRTGDEAVVAGVDPREVWLAICDAQDVPLARRHGVGQREPRR
jgi:hypothetical protein